MSNFKFTPGGWKWAITTCEDDIEIFSRVGDEGVLIAGMAHPMHSGLDHETTEANAHLIAAAPDLYAYAEFEARCAALLDFENELSRDKYPDDEVARLMWQKREELFPEIAARFPTPTDEERREWCGDEWVEETALETRENMYGDWTCDFPFGTALHEERVRLRTAALAKARGEATDGQ